MPFPFVLPTTSNLPISGFLRCETHPSLILAATTHRNILRTLLKQQRKLPLASQSSQLSSILNALNDYVPYLLAIEAGLTGNSVGDEEVDVALENEIDVAWSPCLSNSIPGRDPRRIKGRGLDYELCFVLHTLACTHTLLARRQLHTLYATTTPSNEQRSKSIEAGMKHLLQASSLHSNVSTRASDLAPPLGAKDILPEIQSGLSSIALAEATLLAILVHDPYPAIVIQDRNKDDREWMYRAPEIPKVRAGLFVRLAVQASEHAGKALVLTSGTDESFTRYIRNLQKTAKAKACRFAGIDAELGGRVGEGIAWLIAAKKELGFKVTEENSKVKGFAKLKKNITEKREDRKIEKGELWGADAGRVEEVRVVELLEEKWNKANDMINTQLVPPTDSLSSLPSGREIHQVKPFIAPKLDPDVLAQMRAPLDRSELAKAEAASDEDSDDENTGEAPGAFPVGSGHTSSYY